jgi:hypothetical protein
MLRATLVGILFAATLLALYVFHFRILFEDQVLFRFAV